MLALVSFGGGSFQLTEGYNDRAVMARFWLSQTNWSNWSMTFTPRLIVGPNGE